MKLGMRPKGAHKRAMGVQRNKYAPRDDAGSSDTGDADNDEGLAPIAQGSGDTGPAPSDSDGDEASGSGDTGDNDGDESGDDDDGDGD